jgi:hypothetical protein
MSYLHKVIFVVLSLLLVNISGMACETGYQEIGQNAAKIGISCPSNCGNVTGVDGDGKPIITCQP